MTYEDNYLKSMLLTFFWVTALTFGSLFDSTRWRWWGLGVSSSFCGEAFNAVENITRKIHL